MAYGNLKADNLIYDDNGTDTVIPLENVAGKAPLASPVFTGNVDLTGAVTTGVTQAAGDGSTKLATTLYVDQANFASTTGANFTGDVDIAQGDKLTLGSNYEIYETSGSSELRIESLAGHMRHKLPANQSVLIEGPTDEIAKFTEGGACELYHDGEKALDTHIDGIRAISSQARVGGVVSLGLTNNCKIETYDHTTSSANNYDNETLKIYSQHGGNNPTNTSIIYEGMHDQTWRAISSAHGPAAELGRVNYDGGWELYYHDIQGTVNNSFAGSTCTKKLETTLTGVEVTGELTSTTTFQPFVAATTTVTAAVNTKYTTDTSSSAFTLTLPASPTVGQYVTVTDIKGTWATNNLTVAQNGNNIQGAAADLVCNVNHAHVTLIYTADATTGWVVT